MSRNLNRSGKLELTNWDYLADVLNVRPEALMVRADLLVTDRHKQIGLHYQQFVYSLLLALPEGDINVVETGVRTGISTFFILAGIMGRGKDQGHLFSCDPMYKTQGHAENRFREFENFPYWKGREHYFANWKFYGEKSQYALEKIAKDTGGDWDVFVHDSDHGATNMKFELEFAWAHLKPGGFLILDDAGGTDSEGHHTVFEDWANQNDLQWSTIGQAVIVKKPGGIIIADPDKPAAPVASRIIPPVQDTLESAPAEEVVKEGGIIVSEPAQTLEEMEAAVNAAVANAPPAAPAEEEKKEDDTNSASDDLSDLTDLSKPGKTKASVNFTDADLDELDADDEAGEE